MAIGEFLDSWTSPAVAPMGLTFDGQHLWICDFTGAKVYKVTRKGVAVGGFDVAGKQPLGIDFDGQYLWLVDFAADELLCYTREGVLLKTIAGLETILRACCVNGPYLWTAGTTAPEERVAIRNREGVMIKYYDHQPNNWTDLFFDGQYLWAADNVRDLIICSIRGEVIVKEVSTVVANLYGLCFDGQYLWASDAAANVVYMLSRY